MVISLKPSYIFEAYTELLLFQLVNPSSSFGPSGGESFVALLLIGLSYTNYYFGKFTLNYSWTFRTPSLQHDHSR